MHRQLAEVRTNKLYLSDGKTIKLDSKLWFEWLEVNHAFQYRLNDSLLFTVRKEQGGRGKFYWWLYYKQHRQQIKQHLATSAQLTHKLLLTQATHLVYSQIEMDFSQFPELPETIASTIEDIQQQIQQDIYQLEKHYRQAIEQLTAKSIEFDLTLDSEAIVRRIFNEVDLKQLLNIENITLHDSKG